MIDLDAICECGHAFGKHTPMGHNPGECMECYWAQRRADGSNDPSYEQCRLEPDGTADYRIVAGSMRPSTPN